MQTVSTKFKLVHYFQHCAITSPGKQLPKWGFEQQEVSCNPNLRDKNALWNVEDNYFELCKYSADALKITPNGESFPLSEKKKVFRTLSFCLEER